MNLDLNEFSQQIVFWRNVSIRKSEDIENLQNQLLILNKKNELLENSRANLLHEIDQLNNSVADLQKSFARLEDIQNDNKILEEERVKMQETLDNLEKLYKDQIKDIKAEMELLKVSHKEELETLLSLNQNEASRQLTDIRNVLYEKENIIQDLNQQISRLINEKDQDLLKIRVQCEDKIGKLKQQITKSKVPNVSGPQMHDVFRQKYLKLEKDSSEEISKLKEEKKLMELLIESLKSKIKNESFSSVLIATNKDVNEPSKDLTKLSKETCVVKDVDMITDEIDEDDDFLLKRRKLNKVECVQPQRRKLFNLNQNYFVKS